MFAFVSDLDILQGINATIICYGATGSGKTYTMQQLISLAVADVYDTVANMPLHEYTIQASALEIYNERGWYSAVGVLLCQHAHKSACNPVIVRLPAAGLKLCRHVFVLKNICSKEMDTASARICLIVD